MFARVRPRRTQLRAALAAGLALAIAGCGEQPRQDADEPAGTFTVELLRVSFPTKQRLAQRSQMEIAVRNAGDQPVPNVAATVEPVQPGATSKADAFAEASSQAGLADPSRPVWIVDAGPRGGITAYSNTWALGRLNPGEVKTFVWRVTAMKPGTHVIRYTVAAGLDGKAKARLPGGELPSGQLRVDISGAPADAAVGPNGEVITRTR